MRPKWQHRDPAVRAAAVMALDDQAALEEIVENDADEAVKHAALRRLKDQDVLARIAKSNSPFNTIAFEALTEPRKIVEVARHAEFPQVRGRAVEKIDDPVVLHQIATQDLDPAVRREAKHRRLRLGADPMGDFLKNVLSQLQVAETKAERTAEFCGSLDDICGAITTDRRFRINGLAAKDEPAEPGARPHTAADAASGTRTFVEVIASEHGPGATAHGNAVHYRIKIWRPAENVFNGTVEQWRGDELRADAEAWSRSSGGDYAAPAREA